MGGRDSVMEEIAERQREAFAMLAQTNTPIFELPKEPTLPNEAQSILDEVIGLPELSDVQVAARLAMEAGRFPDCEIKKLAIEAARRVLRKSCI